MIHTNPNAKVVVLLPTLASAFFDEIFNQMHREQIPEPQWPGSVSGEPAKDYNWLKGTTWHWNEWEDVQFQQDGSFDAPTPSCTGHMKGACRWTAQDKHIYIWWGRDGLHVMKPSQMEASDANTMRGKRKNHDGVQYDDYDIYDDPRYINNKRHTGPHEIKARFARIHDLEASTFDDDLYEYLGVDVEADEQQIKKAYRKLSLKYHPDKCQEETCGAEFKKVGMAYEILSDKQKKILYDTGGRQAVKDAEKGQMQKGNDVNVEISVSLSDLYSGNSVETSLQRRIVCVGCDRPSHAKTDRCRRCQGCPAETKTVMKQMGPGMFMQQQVQVPSIHKCMTQNTAIEATIEKGMDNGHTIKFAMMAEQRPGIVPGDVIFTVKTKKHKQFERKGKNLWITERLSVKEALLGFKRTVNHLDGHQVTFEREGVTRPEFVMKIQGEGMPVHNVPAEYGSLFVKFVVDYPKTLTSKQKDLVAQVFEEGHDEL